MGKVRSGLWGKRLDFTVKAESGEKVENDDSSSLLPRAVMGYFFDHNSIVFNSFSFVSVSSFRMA